MTASPRTLLRLDRADLDRLEVVGRGAGLDLMGACTARPWTSTRDRILRQRERGRAGSMAFTYRNPDRSTDATRVLPRAATLIVGARRYAAPQAEPRTGIGVAARVARYAATDEYAALRSGLAAVAAELRSLGGRAVVVADDNALVDREAAWRAGLGWYGKNSLLLAPGEGSWFVLGSVVTDARLGDVDVPRPVADGCGSCARCVDGCPTGAIVAHGVVDVSRCLSWLLQAHGSFPVEFREALGDRLYGCDDCQEVCPPNRTVELRTRRAEAPAPPDSDAAGSGSWLDAAEMLALDDESLMARCDRWYIADRDPRVVRRNLLVILGNSGSADPTVHGLVERYRTGTDPLLAEHAAWAAERMAPWRHQTTTAKLDR